MRAPMMPRVWTSSSSGYSTSEISPSNYVVSCRMVLVATSVGVAFVVFTVELSWSALAKRFKVPNRLFDLPFV